MTLRTLIRDHRQWVFSGVGLSVLGLLWAFFRFVTGLTNADIARSTWSALRQAADRTVGFFTAPVATHRGVLIGLFLAGVALTVLALWVFTWWLSFRDRHLSSFLSITELANGKNIYRWRWLSVYGKYRVTDVGVYCRACNCQYVQCRCPICGGIADSLLTDDHLQAIAEWQAASPPKAPGA